MIYTSWVRSLLPLTLSLSAALPSAALAYDEPQTFRGIAWGASQAEALAILKEAARPTVPADDQPTCVSRTLCRQRARLGTVRVQYSYLFRDDRFVGAVLGFSTLAYPRIRERFIELYGPPRKEETQEFRTKLGQVVPNETLRWIGDRILITLQQYGRASDKGAAEIVTVEEANRRESEIMRRHAAGPTSAPAGFGEFSWGTTRTAIVDRLAKEACRFQTTTTTLQGHQKLVCAEYQLPEVGGVLLELDFIDERLRGYRIVVPDRLRSKLAAAAPQILRGPELTASESKQWPATVSLPAAPSLDCPAGRACLTVKTY